MKRLLLAVLLLGLSLPGFAQSSAVPDYISYQGRVTDASGVPIANGTSTNRVVVFRLYDSPTAGTRLYSEQQTVTIATGDFSVLLGMGTAVGTEVKPALSTVFTNATRFLGVTVAEAGGALGAEISPRQQIVTTAFAFRSKVAESVVDQSVTTAMLVNNAVNTTQVAESAITSSKISDLSILANDIADGAITSAKITDGNVTTVDLANGAVTAAKLGADVGMWSANGGNVYRGTGRVGIGTSSPATSLHVNGTIAAHGGDASGLGGGYVFSGVGDSDGGLFSPADGTITIRTNATEKFRVQPTGYVGIGITNPGALLSLGATTANTKLAFWDNGTPTMGIGVQSAQFRFHVGSSTDRFSFLSAPAGSEVFTVKGDGRVGIGNTAPGAPLDIGGSGLSAPGGIQAILSRGADGSFRLVALNGSNVNTPGAVVSQFGILHTSALDTGLIFLRGSGTTDGSLCLVAGNHEGLRVTPTGNIGIGTSSPTRAKLEIIGGVTTSAGSYGYLNFNSTGTSSGGGFYSLWADNRIASSEFNAMSDQRIKLVEGRSKGASDLSTLMQIEVTDYRYKDTVAQGNTPQKKVLGQQVEKVFPQAVNRTTDAVPDIYQIANVNAGWIELATDLKKGERVKLITDADAGVHEVLAVEPNRFRTARATKSGKVFVFGREVTDFRVVDYDAIAMLNVSATQELKRAHDAEVAALRAANAALTRRVAELEAAQATNTQRLEAVARRLDALMRNNAIAVTKP